ncbi:MAG: isoleucyl-tRNA synthetase [Chthoniobacteraceae bacterium]|nr:isoleucyl-tRNA synthetase [Chthoniobacteraceae bacterium]
MSQNYKETLHLPKTDFPMKADLVKREPERLARWEAAGLYRQIQDARKGAELFVLHDGPPFANGDVHMGTALNKILKDLIVKSKSMAGFRAPFVPGWDCHGLPIEFKVVKESRGLLPAEVRKRSEQYARKFIDIQRGQFKRLGVLGEWENPYLTLAPGYEAAILRSFARFVEEGLVYQSKKPVYWSTGAQTALAEAEVEYAEREDKAIFVKFPIVTGPLAGEASMVIWTTTPWTLPANVAIAVHPRQRYVVRSFRKKQEEGLAAVLLDEAPKAELFVIAEALLPAFQEAAGFEEAGYSLRAKEEEQAEVVGDWLLSGMTGEQLAGSEAQHPFLPRTARIITAEFVTMDTGTGQVHIAPGHGADDYVAGVQNGLPILSPVDEHGRFTEEVGIPVWAGKYVFDANQEVIEHLRGNGTLLGAQVYKHSYPHCWRSKTPIVFRAVEQFFIRIDALRGAALQAIDQVEWIPHWGRNRIFGTVESRPDWCISRQRSWGVPLPVFYDETGKPILDADIARRVADIVEKEGTNLWFEKDDAWWANAVALPEGTTRRNDTLDVWLDSGVSHEAVLRTHPELRWPADVYIEATDQHRGWFQSSLITSMALNGAAPYKTVVTHGFVVDKDTRKKVSKSEQGTYAKPMNAEHFVGKYGADIVRLWAASVEFTNEVPFSEDSFTQLADAYRQFRNILRILLANLHGFDATMQVATGDLTLVDRWVMSRLQEVIGTCREAYAAYEFRKVFQTLNNFCAVDVSALYVDITKDRMYCDAPGSGRRRATQWVMHRVFDSLARLLAPVLAFTADEAWEFFGKTGSVHLETFPEVDEAWRDKTLEARVTELLELRGVIGQAVEQARKEKLIGNALEASVTLEVATPDLADALQPHAAELEEFFILSDLTIVSGSQTQARLVRNEDKKCARCWRFRPTVGLNTFHPELCERCAEVVTAIEE